ncbi:hypothetical protein E3Q22_03170 [Wallemia mellicola]|uniref:Transcription elongation factor SPT6 n=1 Tax=Wallemia mellicola TaxID=1708541 RepID=A0A4T0M3I3_9BASI|nr:hypothetical protein E3Q24_02926 [Wallemia mellicola]TIB77154.1 hypothetical protein E3Q22_03170 [Wallemia mellicola]TIB96824.1 hypothetical protein E3Q18_02913 [Wallemia mellicola]TIC28898.1 hypothetical protein E3Q10_02891 [Wallemia mellicola]
MSSKGSDEEGEAIPMHGDKDSSEEEDDNSEAEREVREGFIEDEQVDDSEGVRDGSEKKKKKKKKLKKLRRASDLNDEEVDEDDLDLIAENTGRSRRKDVSQLRRLHRRKADDTDEEDLDAEPAEDTSVRDKRNKGVSELINMFNEDANRAVEDDDDDDLGNFIEEDEEDPRNAYAGGDDRRKKKKKQKARKNQRGILSEQAGVDQETMDEIYEVFGDGTEYGWAMEVDEEEEFEEHRGDTKMADVFEPSEIKARLMTDEDEIIRYTDLPERMQLLTPGIAISNVIRDHYATDTEYAHRLPDKDKSAAWIAPRLSEASKNMFLDPLAPHYNLKDEFIRAVTVAVDSIQNGMEVPFIHIHRRDLVSHFDPAKTSVPLAPEELRHEYPAGTSAVWRNRHQMSLLSRSDLWKIYELYRKYVSLHIRLSGITELAEKAHIVDNYFTGTLVPLAQDEMEVTNDLHEWLLGMYPHEIKILQDEQRSVSERQFKRPTKASAYERAKKMPSSELIKKVVPTVAEVAQNLRSEVGKLFTPPTPSLGPFDLAETFTVGSINSQMMLSMAKLIFITELGRDPLIKKHVRDRLTSEGIVSVLPTDKGLNKVDDQHPYNRFLYLKNKPIDKLSEDSTQFLSILAAEKEDLITVSIGFHPDVQEEIIDRIFEATKGEDTGEVSEAWNTFIRDAIFEAFEQSLLISARKYAREWLREKQEDYLAQRLTDRVSQRIDVAPFTAPGWEKGETPSVLSVSAGQGDPRKDAILLVYLDEDGRLREQQKIDNLVDEATMEIFSDILKRREPQVVVVGGMGTQTHGLYQRVLELVKTQTGEQIDPNSQVDEWGEPMVTDEGQQTTINPESGTPVIFVNDDIARIYQHSKRAELEFGELPLTGKYCVGLARYAQSPLNEFAALGEDVTAIAIDPDQRLLTNVKFLQAMEKAFINTVNHIGVDINIAVRDTHYQHLLQFVAGLGPRKAQALVRRIAARGGYITNRSELAHPDLMYLKEFTNAVAFIKITQEFDSKVGDELPDVLDQTRIHPEDYELARKMASDALELDEEDLEGQHESAVVKQLIDDKQNESKLDELNLDDYALNLLQFRGDYKRSTLNLIRDELLNPFGEDRDDFKTPENKDIFTALTGETDQTLSPGTVVPAVVKATKPQFAYFRLDSGVDAFVSSVYATDEGDPDRRMDSIFPKATTVQGMVLNIDYDTFQVELSTRPQDLAMAPEYRKIVAEDEYYDTIKAMEDRESAQRRKQSKANRAPRVVDHPNFHNFSAEQAEQLLEGVPRGEVVIRPSSKGSDHLVVTWKVDEDLYQHIDVLEIDKANEWSLGRLLRIGNATYTDLDEMLVMHVQPMVRKVEELINHEKYHGPTEDDMAKYLHDFVKANIDRSNYAFCLDRKDPGSFVLGFMASAKSALNRWSVQVTPGMYVLNGAQLPTVADLCRAFKLQYVDILKNPRSRLANGGKTPFAGGRTPATGARTPARGTWSATPAQGKASAWGGGNRTPAAGWGGGRTPHHGGRTPAINHGGRTPAQAVQAANANWNNNSSWEAPGSEGWNNSAPTQGDSWNTSGDASTASWDNSRGWNS